MNKGIWAVVHTAAFFIGIAGYFLSIHNQALSSLILQLSYFYVAAFLLYTKHRHFLPALAMLFVFKALEFPISQYLFGQSLWVYLGCIIFFDIALALSLYKFHQAPALRKLLRVTGQPVPGGIPQVNGVLLALILSLIQAVLVFGEVALYKANVLSADQLVIYPSYQPVKIMIKILELAAVWGMLIDSVYAEENRAVRLLNTLRKVRGQ